MEQALVAFVEGRVIRNSALPTADLAIRKVAALEALSRKQEPLNPKWLDTFQIDPNLWPTSAVIDWYLVLKRQPRLPQHDARMRAAEQILRSRLNFQGTTMGFSTEKTDALWWLMVSADANANKLILAMNDVAGWREDMPRHRARVDRPHAARTLEHDGRERVGRARAGEVLGAVRSDDADRHDEREARRRDLRACVEARRRHEDVCAAARVARIARRPRARAGRQRRAVGDAVEHRGDPAEGPVSSGYRVTRTIAPIRQQTRARGVAATSRA
jgi:hypothetical protein